MTDTWTFLLDRPERKKRKKHKKNNGSVICKHRGLGRGEKTVQWLTVVKQNNLKQKNSPTQEYKYQYSTKQPSPLYKRN